MQYLFSYFWAPPQHSILLIALACILGIGLQSCIPSFLLCLPIIFLCILLCTDHKQLIHCLLISFGAAFLYEYQIQSHEYVMQQLAQQSCLELKLIDKEPIAHSPLYKEWCTAEIYNFCGIFPWKIYIYSMAPSDYIPGDIVKIGNCKLPAKKKNDFTNYLCKEHVAGTLFLSKDHKIELINRPTQSITRWLWQKRNAMLEIFCKNSSQSTLELASCIFWGNRTIIKQNPDIKESFKKIGIVHYLARSGLHLIIFMFVWQVLLSLLCISHRKKLCILIVLCCGYYILTWSSVSFIRALAAFALGSIAMLSKQRTSILYLLCLIAIVLLLYNPIQLLFLDFQLTFGLTFTLIWHNYVESKALLGITKSS